MNGKRLINVMVLFFSLFGIAMSANAQTYTEEQKLVASDGESGERFGRYVAVDNNTFIIGAPYDDVNDYHSGSAYVFTRDGAGTWIEQKLIANDNARYDEFGYSVAVAGDSIFIGAPLDDDNGTASGSVYIFTRDSAGIWIEKMKLTASDGVYNDRFGISLVAQGDTVVICATGADAAYVFTRTGDSWSEQAKLTPSDVAVAGLFGNAVAIDGDTVVVGADTAYGNEPISGAAYVFTRIGDSWAEQAKLVASDGAYQDYFGDSVAIEGDTAVIGAFEDDDYVLGSGSAYVFTRFDGVWTEQFKLTASDPKHESHFGSSVTIDSDAMLISHPGGDGIVPDSGVVYKFTRDEAGSWTEQAKLVASDGTADNDLGMVALDGDTALVGSILGDGNMPDTGAAYVFNISPELPVIIDIKPGSDSNIVNLRSGGLIRVAILSDDEFDPADVDFYTLRFGPDGAEIVHGQPHMQDVNGDGDLDLVVHFRIQQTGIQCGDTEATLTAQTWGGELMISGTDSVNTVGCGSRGNTARKAEY